ncbi:calcium homeostasis endoplasmic reticulum protein [Pelomyxa schiedti]|nr:calcium homeostasis endoplasmic reticulum protein [Pelomyxa schiedti]
MPPMTYGMPALVRRSDGSVDVPSFQGTASYSDFVRLQQHHVQQQLQQRLMSEAPPSTEYLLECDAMQNETNDTPTEMASLETPIPATNLGYKLLQKMGWSGSGLGRDATGRTEPVPVYIHIGQTGLGKIEEDDEHTEASKIHRPLHASEIELTDQQKHTIEKKIVIEEAREKEVQDITRVFYCELCNKQYKKISEFESHLSSYDHNHKKRFKDMQQMDRLSRDARSKKQQNKEMKRLMQEAEARAKATSMRAPPAIPPAPVLYKALPSAPESVAPVSPPILPPSTGFTEIQCQPPSSPIQGVLAPTAPQSTTNYSPQQLNPDNISNQTTTTATRFSMVVQGPAAKKPRIAVTGGFTIGTTYD